jgi:hypothetical protein
VKKRKAQGASGSKLLCAKPSFAWGRLATPLSFACKTGTDQCVSGTYNRIRSKPLPPSPNSADDSVPPKVDIELPKCNFQTPCARNLRVPLRWRPARAKDGRAPHVHSITGTEKMESIPDPAFCFVTSIHTDVPKTFDRIARARRDEAQTGLATGAIRARLAESFRQQKLALRRSSGGLSVSVTMMAEVIGNNDAATVGSDIAAKTMGRNAS